jgi:hypothetical protein
MRLITTLAVVSVSIFALAGCAADAEPTNTNTQNQNPPVEPLDEEGAPAPYDFRQEAANRAKRVGTDPLLRDAVTDPDHRIVNTEAEEIVKGFGRSNNILEEKRFTGR